MKEFLQIALQTIKTKEKHTKYVDLACDAPPDKSKHLLILHVIHENDGIDAGNVRVTIINQ